MPNQISEENDPDVESVLETTRDLRLSWAEFDPFSQTTSIFDLKEREDNTEDNYPDWTVLYESAEENEEEEQVPVLVQVEEVQSDGATLVEQILSPPIPQSFMMDNTFFEWLRELEEEAIEKQKQEAMDEEWVDYADNWFPVPYDQYVHEWEVISGI